MHTREKRSQLSVIEKLLGTGGASTRELYAWSRRLRSRRELARRRSRVPALAGSPDLVIPPDPRREARRGLT